MARRLSLAMAAAVVAVGALALGTQAPAQPAGVKAGVLTCNVSSGWGFVFGSSRSLRCTYSPRPGVAEHYAGAIKKFGVDIGYVSSAVIVWGVIAPTVAGGASVGVGVGANVLIGGSNKQFALQPVSIEGNQGLNVAAGIGAISLRFER